MALPHSVDPAILQGGRKRARQYSPDEYMSSGISSHDPEGLDHQNDDLFSSLAGQSTNFRNVSACSRCRSRKNRCDQMLPSCTSCAKAGVACVGYDVITKKETPRSYVFYLENRVEVLERLLISHGIQFPSANDLGLCSRRETATHRTTLTSLARFQEMEAAGKLNQRNDTLPLAEGNYGKPGTVAQDPAASTVTNSNTAASFMKMTYTTLQAPALDGENAVKAHGYDHSSSEVANTQTSPLPEKSTAQQLVQAYFERANPQIPILQRKNFMVVFDKVYSTENYRPTPREQYLLNMVFAIGAGHGFIEEQPKDTDMDNLSTTSNKSRGNVTPEEYYSRASVHFEASIRPENGELEVLQAVLLLASFALIRPVSPGVWYITGMAVRIAVDMGLHCEDDSTHDEESDAAESDHQDSADQDRQSETDLAQWRVRDLRRRLWWCTYSLDRLVSISIGRPFSISDHDISTQLPALQKDVSGTDAEFTDLAEARNQQSCTYVAHHFIRLRILQSDIYATTQSYKEQISNKPSPVTQVQSPNDGKSTFLIDSHSEAQRQWLEDMEKRLHEWKVTAPTKDMTGVAFPKAVFEFYYWQTIILLHRHNASTPTLINEIKSILQDLHVSKKMVQKRSRLAHQRYLKVAEAGQKVLRLYRQRHLAGCIKYTYSSAHYLFSVGILYLHAIAQSTAVRQTLSPDDMDFTILAAKSIFTDMLDTCPNAKRWMEAFDLTAKATTRITRLCAEFDEQHGDWEQSEATQGSSNQATPLTKLSSDYSKDTGVNKEAGRSVTNDSGDVPTPIERYFGNGTTPGPFGDKGDLSMNVTMPTLSPLDAVGQPQAESSNRGNGDADKSMPKELIDLETMWQLDGIASEAPDFSRIMDSEPFSFQDTSTWLLLPGESIDDSEARSAKRFRSK